jgi:hypothetical protein
MANGLTSRSTVSRFMTSQASHERSWLTYVANAGFERGPLKIAIAGAGAAGICLAIKILEAQRSGKLGPVETVVFDRAEGAFVSSDVTWWTRSNDRSLLSRRYLQTTAELGKQPQDASLCPLLALTGETSSCRHANRYPGCRCMVGVFSRPRKGKGAVPEQLQSSVQARL